MLEEVFNEICRQALENMKGWMWEWGDRDRGQKLLFLSRTSKRMLVFQLPLSVRLKDGSDGVVVVRCVCLCVYLRIGFILVY